MQVSAALPLGVIRNVPSLSELCTAFVCLKLFENNEENVEDIFRSTGLPMELVERLLSFQCKGSMLTDFGLKWYINRALSNGFSYKLLNFSNCGLLTDKGLSYIANLNSRKRRPDTVVRDPSSMKETSGAALTQLILTNCSLITDEGVIEILRSCVNMTTLISLHSFHYVSLLTYNVLGNCFQITDTAFVCPNDFPYYELRTIGTHISFSSPFQDISNCNQITDQGVSNIVRLTTSLHYLNLSNCKQITDRALEKVALNCHNLVSIDVSECVLLTDAGLEVRRIVVRLET